MNETSAGGTDAASAKGIEGAEAQNTPWPSIRRAYYAAWVLAAVQMCAQLNNGVTSLLVEPIKRDLGLSDLQLSYLLGFALALFYVVIGIPAARLVDRYNRKWLTTGTVLIWSAATAGCGLAQNFWQFFIARFGIGAGESISAPLAYSQMADYFPPSQLPRGIAIYNVGYSGGIALSLLLGALMIHLLAGLPEIDIPLIGTLRDWQLVFILTGLVGVPVAMLTASMVEPPRRDYVHAVNAPAPDAATLREVLVYMFKHWPVYGPIFIGLCFTSLHMFGLAAWGSAFYVRTFGMSPAKVGLYTGSLNLLLTVPSLLGAIWINDWFRKLGHADTNMRVLAIGFSVSAPFMIASFLMPNPWLVMAMSGIGSALMLFAAPSLNSAMQIVTPNRMRGQVTALYLFMMYAVGGAFGPTYFALITKYVWKDEALLGYSIATSAAVVFPAAALIYWAGVKPYRERILAMRANGAPV